MFILAKVNYLRIYVCRVFKFIVLLMLFVGVVANAQDLQKLGKGKAFDKGGSIGVGVMMTAQQGIQARRVPFSWYINGSPTLKFYDITLPFSFVYSEQERNFTQPFNKYGVSPNYKWLTLHAGWRNVHYSDYTLAGATFLGGGFDINPGKFRAGAIYGKFRNKTVVNGEQTSRFSYLLPSYERWGFGAKVGFGKGGNYTDLIFFRAKDRLDNSVMQRADSSNVRPMENVAIGLKSNYTVLKKIDINLDFAVSAVTLDSRLEDRIDGLKAIQPYKNIIKINRSTVPYLAGVASIGYFYKFFRIRAEYRRVDPEYQTLGSYYVNNDLEQYTLSPSLTILKGKIMLNGSYGIRTNNLLGDQINTTTNRIGSAFLNINPKPNYGFTFNYSNYGTNTGNGQAILNDSIIFSVVNQSYGGNFRVTKTKGDLSKNFNLNSQYQNLNDNNIVTRAFTESRSFIINAGYNVGRGKKGFNAGSGLNYSNIKTYNRVFQLLGPVINIRKNLKKIKTNISGNASFLMKFQNTATQGNVTNFGLNLNYTPHKKHNFNLLANATFNNTNIASIYTFREQRLSFRYNYQL